jgi:8-oxo-dGTP pyrophosphatase MutT (NUDIX family)
MRRDVKSRWPSSNAVPLPAGQAQIGSEFVRLADLRKLSRCEQVAAVCYRVRSSEIEFLLVRTRGSLRWTFPKGSAEPGLTPAQAAALEAFEEAGVHGRIEQTSFARYVCRKRGKSKRRLALNETVVSAHLCEVLRLSKPKERGRDRTWFSAKEAKRRLRKGRNSGDAAEFDRIVEKAVSCISVSTKQQENPRGRSNENAMLRLSHLPTFGHANFGHASFPKDALHAVQFEASSQLHGWNTRLPLLPNDVQRLETAQRSSLVTGNRPPKLLRGEVLPFSAMPTTNSHSARTRKVTRQVSAKG